MDRANSAAGRSTDRPRRSRSAEGTRAEILAAARRLFTERGYQGVGVREIAAEAGANMALINRYFGSKEGLFEAAVPSSFGISDDLLADRSTLAFTLARYVVREAQKPDGFDPTLAMVRSAGSTEAALRMSRGLEEEFVTPLAAVLGGASARADAAAVVAVLAGFAVMRTVLRLPSLQDDDSAERLLRETLDAAIGRKPTD